MGPTMHPVHDSGPRAHVVDAVRGAQLLGVSERSFHELRRRPEFPAPIALFGTRTRRWRVADLLEWLANVPSAATQPSPPQLLAGKARKRARPSS
jgi:predicted DNA-binding transcriptional regulator AlpA